MTEPNILAIASFIIVSLLGIVGYFLKTFAESIKSLSLSVDMLRITVTRIEQHESDRMKNCDNLHNIIDKRLSKGSEVIDSLKLDVAVLKSKE